MQAHEISAVARQNAAVIFRKMPSCAFYKTRFARTYRNTTIRRFCAHRLADGNHPCINRNRITEQQLTEAIRNDLVALLADEPDMMKVMVLRPTVRTLFYRCTHIFSPRA
ncbi:MAG: hypothetical protein RSD23_03465 [Ruthenibacterium sp.]